MKFLAKGRGTNLIRKKIMIGDWKFLKSRRFWGLVIIAIVGVLENEGIISGEIAKGIITILAGFIAVRTVDRFGENIAKQ